MFRHKNMYLDWIPQDGVQVEAQALVTLYEARGEFQLTIEQLRRAGTGVLFEAFERLKARLQQEGLFSPGHKLPIPPYPRQIGVITSPHTAALKDVLTTLQQRLPSLPVIIYPAPVQGKEATTAIVAALQTATQRNECDVLILCRGGGSIEDLWVFNEEVVARAIAACPIPVITGIGHETDFTIADFVADVRAPTPTGAAQLARMQAIDLLTHRLIHPGEKIRHQLIHLSQLHNRLLRAWERLLEIYTWRIEILKQQMQSVKPAINTREKHLQESAARLQRAMMYRLENLQTQLSRHQQHLTHLNPKAVLARGYSIAYTASGEILQNSQQIHTGDNVRLVFAKGSARANITETNK